MASACGALVFPSCLFHDASPWVRNHVRHITSVHMFSLAGLISRTPPLTFSDIQSPIATLIPLYPSLSTLSGDILAYWIGKIVWTCAASGSRICDSLPERRKPYLVGQALRLILTLNRTKWEMISATYSEGLFWNGNVYILRLQSQDVSNVLFIDFHLKALPLRSTWKR